MSESRSPLQNHIDKMNANQTMAEKEYIKELKSLIYFRNSLQEKDGTDEMILRCNNRLARVVQDVLDKVICYGTAVDRVISIDLDLKTAARIKGFDV